MRLGEIIVPAKAIISVTSSVVRFTVPPGPAEGGVVDLVVQSGKFNGKPRVSNPVAYEYIGGQRQIAPVKFEQREFVVKQKPAVLTYCFGYVFLATGYRGVIF